MPFINRYKIMLIIIIITGFIISCSGSIPQIGQIVWQVNFLKEPSDTQVVQALSLFILVEDEDGITDIDSVYIIHDELELFWKLTPETWSQKNISSKNWIGSNNISMNDNSNLPSGKYRILVLDKAGERDTLQINISSNILVFDNKISFPNLQIGSDIVIKSDFSENTLRIYDNSMALLKNLKIEKGKISRSIIENDTKSKAHWISLYSFNEETGTGLINGPYKLNN